MREHTFVPAWRPTDRVSYAYLLGLYLGDGCLTDPGRTIQLVITCDAAYPQLVEACAEAVACVMPSARVGVHRVRGVRAMRVVSSTRRWLEVFPQHGPGRKHLRSIELEDWQQQIVDEHPEAFLRGLIHSDGCRTVNRFKTRLPSGRTAEYAYPRYFFSNLSADIRGLFCASCDRLGIRWSKSNPRNISISHRDGVAALDAFVGPKR